MIIVVPQGLPFGAREGWPIPAAVCAALAHLQRLGSVRHRVWRDTDLAADSFKIG